MAVLISTYLRYDFEEPGNPANDHLIFSKGHASPLLYSIYKAVGATEYTVTNTEDPTYFEVDGEGFNYFGAGHIMGTTVMGSSRADSVVDSDQRCWDHDNLYIVGSSTFPATGTANPTLTIAALSFKTADILGKRLSK